MLRANLLSVFLLITSGSTLASPAVDDVAPDFRLPDQIGKMHSLEDYAGQWVVLYFYPKDDTHSADVIADLEAFSKNS